MGLKAETERFIMAAQDQSLYTRNYYPRIIENGVDPKCRMCNQYDETVDPLVSGCSVIDPTEYKSRYKSLPIHPLEDLLTLQCPLP